jgi:asparagine synthase (glutamine-hydrolysing)
MCGIFGIVQSHPIELRHLAEMSRLLRHRGPDDEGFASWDGGGVETLAGENTPPAVMASDVPYAPHVRLDERRCVGPGVVLGHRRLSIVDLSPRGHQPMSFANRYWIVYNGEIYNYLELRRELATLGYDFRTETDTEVILAAYDAWGTNAFSRFNGMWTVAIVDTERKTLLFSRDRFGVKPLYFQVQGDRLAFASEIKALHALPTPTRHANQARLLDFLIWNVSDHTSETMFSGIEQLPAGHYAVVDLADTLAMRSTTPLAIKTTRWYSLPAALATPVASAEAAGELRELLRDAVRLRLRADVPVGSCLSGGVDSSAIVCMMSQTLQDAGALDRLKTFTAASVDVAYDESHYAKLVIERAKSDAYFCTPDPDRLFEDLERLIWHQDEPFGSSSIFAQWSVFELARQHGVVVMLDGQGADEILGGYRGFFGAYLGTLLTSGRLPTLAREASSIHGTTGFGYTRLAGYALAYANPGMRRFLGRFDGRAFSDRTWIGREYRDAFRHNALATVGGQPRSVREMSVAQLTATNLPMLLHWEDRNSMAFSVEARVPFLDYRVVELCLSLSDELKLGGGIPKAVLRKGLRGVVPDPILDRRDKMGFITAEPLWATRDRAPVFRAALADAVDRLSPTLDPSILSSFDGVVAGRRPFDYRYWRAITAGRWAARFGLSVG